MEGMAIGIGGEEIPPRERFCRLIKAVKKADRCYVPIDCGFCLSTYFQTTTTRMPKGIPVDIAL